MCIQNVIQIDQPFSLFRFVQIDHADIHVEQIFVHQPFHIQMVPVADPIFELYPQKQVQKRAVVIRNGNIKTGAHNADIQTAFFTVLKLPNEKVGFIVIEHGFVQLRAFKIFLEITVGLIAKLAIRNDLEQRSIMPRLERFGKFGSTVVFVSIRPDGFRNPGFDLYVANVIVDQRKFFSNVVFLILPDKAVVAFQNEFIQFKVRKRALLSGTSYLL